jgi:hypothetical protein
MTPEERDQLLLRLERALIGDPEMGHKGAIHRLETLEAYVEADKDLKKKVTGGVIVLSFIGSSVVTFLVWVFNKFTA